MTKMQKKLSLLLVRRYNLSKEMSEYGEQWSGNLVPLTRPDGLMFRRKIGRSAVCGGKRLCTHTNPRATNPGLAGARVLLWRPCMAWSSRVVKDEVGGGTEQHLIAV